MKSVLFGSKNCFTSPSMSDPGDLWPFRHFPKMENIQNWSFINMDLRLQEWTSGLQDHPAKTIHHLRPHCSQAFQSWNEICGEARPKPSVLPVAFNQGGKQWKPHSARNPPNFCHWSLPNLLLRPSIHFFCHCLAFFCHNLTVSSIYLYIRDGRKCICTLCLFCDNIQFIQCLFRCAVFVQCLLCEAALRII